MKSQLLVCTVLAFVLPLPAIAQGGTQDPEAGRPRVLISGKVVLSDGTPLPSSAAVDTVCKGQKRIAAHTDSQGRFNFTIGEMNSMTEAIGGGFEDASIAAREGMSVGNTPNVTHNLREWRACGVTAELPGFTSEVVELMQRTGDEGGNIGLVTLHRSTRVEGLTISPTSAAAPDSAKKAFDRGLDQEKNAKWDAAAKSFQKAIQVYPRYAVAWLELGRVQVMQKDLSEAKHSFQQSVAADPNYQNPYLGLMQIAVQEQNWQVLVDVTAKIIGLNPGGSPEVWFYNGVANYNLGKLAEAEKSAQQGLKLDTAHHFPKLEYLLGIVFEEQHDYAAANEHMQAYLHLASSPQDVAAAQKELAEIAKFQPKSAANSKN
jgi:tetratricopeptide (TPR) repeat protein